MLRGAIIYNSQGYLPILHTMRDEAEAANNRALAEAASVLIAEYIHRSDRSDRANKLRRQAIRYYKKAAGI